MPKYKFALHWDTIIVADTEEEALDHAFEQWQDVDFARDVSITKRRSK
jgi:hypothetical protein